MIPRRRLRPGGARTGKWSDLGVRTLSAALIAAVAFACIWFGGWFSTALIVVAGCLMIVELGQITTGPMLWDARRITLEIWALMTGTAAGAVLMQKGYVGWAVMAVAFGLIVAAMRALARHGLRPSGEAKRGFFVVVLAAILVVFFDGTLSQAAQAVIIAIATIAWSVTGAGVLWSRTAVLLLGAAYVSAAVLCFVALRDSEPFGLLSILWAVLVVIGADVGGYFAGKTLGGPKLWPRISPKKTWSGALGGIALAALIGALFSWATTGTYFHEVAIASILIAILSQGGDLAESAVKRRFGVKDASDLIPGHGGVLDRLDGHMAAVLVAALATFPRDQAVFIW